MSSLVWWLGWTALTLVSCTCFGVSEWLGWHHSGLQHRAETLAGVVGLAWLFYTINMSSAIAAEL